MRLITYQQKRPRSKWLSHPYTYRKNKNSDRTHARGKANPLSVSARGADLFKLLSFITILVLMTGCESIPFRETSEGAEREQVARALLANGRLQEAAEKYLYLASQVSSPLSQDYRLKAIEIYLKAQSSDTAEALLAKINPTRSTPRQQARMSLLAARVALAKQNPERAFISLRRIRSRYCRGEADVPLSIPEPCGSVLPNSFWIKFFQTRALTHSALGESYLFDAARDRMALDALLTKTAEIEANHRVIWQLLLSLPSNLLSDTRVRPATLSSLSPSQIRILRGWLTLADIVKEHVLNKTSPRYGAFSRALGSWRKQYSGHPARRFLLSELLSITEDKPPTHIALLLPLDDIFAGAANAVRDGFLSAWFKDTKRIERPKITIRNTVGSNIQLVYNEVMEAGAEFVVGPLDKPSVALLEELPDFPIPILTLNHGKEIPTGDDGNDSAIGTLTLARTFIKGPVMRKVAANKLPLYQFTLSPESEAKQTAQRAWYDGHMRAAILTPRTPWGRRMEQTFVTTWEQLGGVVVERRAFPAELKEISATVERLLKTDEAMARRKSATKPSDEPQESNIELSDTDVDIDPEDELKQRLMDYDAIDCIFMAAFPREARQLQPQIKFHYGIDVPIPVYATSHVFSGTANPTLDEDLDGITFGDMPWVLQRDPESKEALRNVVTSTWPESTRKYLRFYAFGIDAYRIIPYLKRLGTRNFPNFKGETGELSIDSKGHVNRQLLWAVMRRGKPMPDKNGKQYNRYRKDMKWEM
uniref:Penicillin-binding protein activator n=1 Tax=Candidatus Kentrum sp. TUN TaxID=2126343 RepID=A0A450ZXE5_9GAMM|nr:MAG: hypothetical protein BECKTUN1418D_GA0071000_10833 [Candidatus Kentron sp. TUN]